MAMSLATAPLCGVAEGPVPAFVPVLEPAPGLLVDDTGARVEVTTADVADKETVAVPTSTVK
jgi:hypothetical protein